VDAKDQPKDVVPEKQGEDSKDKSQQDSAQPRVYREDEVEAKFSQQRSVLDKKVDKLEKELATATGKASNATSQLSQWQKEQEERELEAASGDKDARSAIEERHKHRETKSELAKVTQELEDEKERGKQRDEDTVKSTKEQNAREIAARLEVDASQLLKFTDGSQEAMEELAKVLPKKGEAKPPIHLDSGKTIGGGDAPTSAKGKIQAGWGELHKTE